jgi:hypothetical protein
MKNRSLSPYHLSWDTKEVLQICASPNGMTGDTTVSRGDNDSDNAMLLWILKSNGKVIARRRTRFPLPLLARGMFPPLTTV